MPFYGYARVSTFDQDLASSAPLKAAGCGVIRAETTSGTRRDGRTELQVLLDFVQPGDALIVTRIDRLARSTKDLQDIVRELKQKGVALCVPPTSPWTPARPQSVLGRAGRVRGARDQPAGP